MIQLMFFLALIMTNNLKPMKNFIKKTFFSNPAFTLYWQTGDMLVVGLADILLRNLQLLDVPNEVTVFVGIVLSVITKYLNKKSNKNA